MNKNINIRKRHPCCGHAQNGCTVSLQVPEAFPSLDRSVNHIIKGRLRREDRQRYCRQPVISSNQSTELSSISGVENRKRHIFKWNVLFTIHSHLRQDIDVVSNDKRDSKKTPHIFFPASWFALPVHSPLFSVCVTESDIQPPTLFSRFRTFVRTFSFFLTYEKPKKFSTLYQINHERPELRHSSPCNRELGSRPK